MKNQITKEKAKEFFKKNGGVLRSAEAIKLGINSKTLYRMKEHGDIQAVDRGIYLLLDDEIEMEYIDLIVAHKRMPRGIICLISALAFHNLTTQIPHHVYIAYQQGWRTPNIEHPPIKVFRYSKSSFECGIEYHIVNGLRLPIYSAVKTVVDCFKFRNRIGINVAIEALRDYWHKNKSASADELLKYAKICRVENVIIPYLESIING